jgi:hypothetical protein
MLLYTHVRTGTSANPAKATGKRFQRPARYWVRAVVFGVFALLKFNC